MSEKIVPSEPTVEMVRAGLREEDKIWPTQEHTEGCVKAVYKAMLAAAPEPATPIRSGPNINVTCYAPGDECLGCDHYYGKAPECKYKEPAPNTAATQASPSQKPSASTTQYDVESGAQVAEPAPAAAPSKLPLTRKQVMNIGNHGVLYVFEGDERKQVEVWPVCDQALRAIDLEAEVTRLRCGDSMAKERT